MTTHQKNAPLSIQLNCGIETTFYDLSEADRAFACKKAREIKAAKLPAKEHEAQAKADRDAVDEEQREAERRQRNQEAREAEELTMIKDFEPILCRDKFLDLLNNKPSNNFLRCQLVWLRWVGGDWNLGCTFVFYHHHLVEFPCSDPLTFGGVVAVRSQAASPRGPGHPREELTKLDNLGWRPAQTSSPLSLVLQHPIPCGQGNREPSYPPDPGKVARACHRHSAKGSLAGVGWRVFTRGQGKIPCSTRLQTAVTRSTANRLR